MSKPTTHRTRFSPTSLVAPLVVLLALLLQGMVAAAPAAAPPRPLDPKAPVADPLDGFIDLPALFVENAGQHPDGVRFHASGARYAFALAPNRLSMTLRMEPADVRLGLRFVGAAGDTLVEGIDRSPARINYLRGADRGAWQTGLAAHHEVAYRDLWPGIDLRVRGEDGQLKYEFHVAPGASPHQIVLAYEGARGLRVADDGSLAVRTPAGTLRDAAPVTYQQLGDERVAVDSAYTVSEDSRSYGFVLGDHDPSRPLIIDPAIDYATFLGGSNHELGADVAVDSSGNVHVTGSTHSDDFATTAGAADRTFNGGIVDAFAAKLTPDGSGLVYATYLGGTPTPLRRGPGDPIEHGRAIAVDASGNAYLAGQTTSSDFPTTSGAFQTSINVEPIETRDDATDGFVTKLGPTGQLVYSTFLGGRSLDDADNITVDSSGNAYVAGRTLSADFPTTTGAFQRARAGGADGFLTLLNAAGSDVLYSTFLGGTDNETADGIALAGSGQVVIAGSTRSADFPTTPGAFQTTHSGGAAADLFEIFVTRLTPSPGEALTYSTFIGGTGRDFAQGLALDSAENAYVTGGTLSADFDTTPGAYDTTFTGTSESFVSKLDSSGASLAYSTFLGGGGTADIAVTSTGEAWVAGAAGPGAPTTPDAVSQANSGSTDAWLARLDAPGSDLLFATFLGGAQADPASAIALDAAGRVVMVGTTYSADFPVTPGALDRSFAGDPAAFWGDAFVVRLDPDGSAPPPPPPPVETETRTFTGEVGRNQTVAHTVVVGAAGTVQLGLDWARSRASLTLRALEPGGQAVFTDSTAAKPKTGSYATSATGQHRIEISNTTRRDTSYTLTVTYPVAGSTPPPPPSPPSLASLELSPTTVTGGNPATGLLTLTGSAPDGGLSVSLSSSNVGVATVPSTVVVPAGQTSTTFTVATSQITSDASVTISAAGGGAARTATLSVTASGGPAVSSLALVPTTVDEGGTSTGTVTLTGAAPAGGLTITLISSNTAIATVPPTLTIPAGSTTADFTVATAQVDVDGSSAITARQGTLDRTVILFVRNVAAPPPPSASLTAVSVSPASVEGGSTSVGTVTLSGAAPAGGATVSLSDNSPAVTVPASVTVAAGATSRTFTITTSSVTTAVDATITATLGSTNRTATLTVTPGSPPPPSTDTVSISRAEYDGDKNELRVAASSSAGATLRVSVTSSGQLIGTMTGGRGEFSWPTNPQNITVTSVEGGSATTSVQLK